MYVTRIDRRGQAGISLVEILVALAVGLLVVAGISAVFVQNNKIRIANERISAMAENGRYSLQVLTEDLQNAGYLAEFNPGKTGVLSTFSAPAAKPNPCLMDLPSLRTAMPLHIQGYDNPATAPVTCISDYRSGTDVIVIRRASTCTPGAGTCQPLSTTAGTEYLFQASQCATQLGATPPVSWRLEFNGSTSLNLTQRNCSTLARIQRYLTHIYYIANNNQAGDGIPTLKRVDLLAGGMSNPLSIAAGIENMQFEYGVDRNQDGTVDVVAALIDAATGSLDGCTASTAPTCMGLWQRTVQVRVHLLARALSNRPGYVDATTYRLGLLADGTVQTVGPFQDARERRVFESTVTLQNPAGRNLTQ